MHRTITMVMGISENNSGKTERMCRQADSLAHILKFRGLSTPVLICGFDCCRVRCGLRVLRQILRFAV